MCMKFINFMLETETLTNFTNLFHPNKLKIRKKRKMMYNFKTFYDQCLKMAVRSSIEHDFYETPNIYPNLNDQQQFRLKKISKIKDDFVAEIKEREHTSKALSKYIASSDVFGKSLIVF